MPKQYKHLFFDLDHTLWDFDKNSEATLRALYLEFDLAARHIDDFDAMFRSFSHHNDRLWDRYRKGYIKRDELRWKRMWLMLLDFKVADTSLSYELSAAYLELLPQQTQLVPFAKDLLEHCKGRYGMHLITNGFETTQRLKLQYSGIARYFTHLITSEKCNSMKPHPGIFEYALRQAGSKQDECIMIGDALEVDIVGAKNFGLDTAYYNPHKLPHQQKPTYEVAGLDELLTVF